MVQGRKLQEESEYRERICLSKLLSREGHAIVMARYACVPARNVHYACFVSAVLSEQ